jgi:hypothetical protein
MIKEANPEKIIIGIIVLILLVWGVYSLSNRNVVEMAENQNTSTTTKQNLENNTSNTNQNISTTTNSTTATTSNKDLIEYKSLKGQIIRLNIKSGSTVSSPLTIKGEVKGPWYFEGTFPINITDENGKTIGGNTATAVPIESWMSENFVNFTASITFNKPANVTKGFIVLNKDNPSGLPQNDDSLKIPVVFK